MFSRQAQRSVRTLEMEMFGPPVRTLRLDVGNPARSRLDAVALDVGLIAEHVMRRELTLLAIEIETSPDRAQEQARRAWDRHEIMPTLAGQRDFKGAVQSGWATGWAHGVGTQQIAPECPQHATLLVPDRAMRRPQRVARELLACRRLEDH